MTGNDHLENQMTEDYSVWIKRILNKSSDQV
jgi:hypothetical protein